MNKRLLSGIAKAIRDLAPQPKTAKGIVDEMEKMQDRRAAFKDKKTSVEKEMKRGSKRTNHRLPL